MVVLSFEAIAEALRAAELPEVDLVVGIARGGVVPASLAAYRLEADLAVVQLNYRDDANRPCHEGPVVLSDLVVPPHVRRVLLVDDVAVTGATLQAARGLLEDRGLQVTTLVMKGQADHVLFPDVRSCVRWPWKPLEQGAEGVTRGG